MVLSSQKSQKTHDMYSAWKKSSFCLILMGFTLFCSREYPKVAKLCIDFLINEQCPCDKSFYSCDLDWCSPRQNLKTALYHSSGDSVIFLLGQHSYFSVQSTLWKWHFSFWSTDIMKILFFFLINSVIFLLGQHYGTEQVILQIK